jgi:Transposase DDE domain group 1
VPATVRSPQRPGVALLPPPLPPQWFRGRGPKAFTQDCRDAGIRFSVGYEVDERVRGAIAGLPESAWQSAVDGNGEMREGAQVTELTDHVDLSSWPEGTRLICRRERPHPGAQLSVFDCEAGYRHTAFITDQDGADVAVLELRHRRRARVEDAIRVGKETGMRKMPFATFAHNEAWLEVSLAAQALLRWAALLCLEGELSLAEPKRVRQRLLHVAGRLVRSGRRVALRLPRSWPWAEALVAAFARLRALPVASP